MNTPSLTVALLLGLITPEQFYSAEATRLTQLPWDNEKFYESNEQEVNKHLARYSEARRGIVKNEAERAKDAAK